MSDKTSVALRNARTQILLDLAAANGGKVTPDQLLAVVGTQKMLLNVLWNARRCGFVAVDQIRDGRKIAYWTVDVTGQVPSATAVKPIVKIDPKTPAVKVLKEIGLKPKAKAAAKVVKAAKPKRNELEISTDKDISSVGSAPEAVKEIKAKNLAKIREVAGDGRYCDGARGVPEGWSAEQARAEVEAGWAELDSFAAPAFLTKEKVKYLV